MGLVAPLQLAACDESACAGRPTPMFVVFLSRHRNVSPATVGSRTESRGADVLYSLGARPSGLCRDMVMRVDLAVILATCRRKQRESFVLHCPLHVRTEAHASVLALIAKFMRELGRPYNAQSR